jgi:hypothetical protein
MMNVHMGLQASLVPQQAQSEHPPLARCQAAAFNAALSTTFPAVFGAKIRVCMFLLLQAAFWTLVRQALTLCLWPTVLLCMLLGSVLQSD